MDSALPSTTQTNRFDAAIGLLALVASLAFIGALSCFKLDGVDLGYHIAYGRHFLDTGRIVDRDPFLIPENAQHFVNANWGSQVVLAAVERAAGAAGLVVLRSILIAAIFAAIILVVRRSTRSPHWIAAAILLAAVGAYERFSLRPELFSYALLSAMLAILIRSSPTRGRVAALVGLQLLWVNIHSYFLVGLLLTGAFAFEAFLLWARFGSDEARRAMRLLGIALILQIAACFINPWEVRGALFPIETLSYLSRQRAMGQTAEPMNAGPWAQISEFHSPFRYLGDENFGRTIRAYLALLALGLAAGVLWGVRGRTGPVVVIALFLLMSLQMRRNIAQLAFVAVPLFCAGCAEIGLRPRPARVGRYVLGLFVTALCVWWTTGIITGRFYYSERRFTREPGVGYSDLTFPRSAVQWLASQDGLKPNLYIDYFTSSNALPWLPPRFKLFVDTNTFAYRDKILGEAFDLGLGRIDHEGFFDRKEINVVLLHCGADTQMLVRALARDFTNWALVYFDRQAVIFVRRIIEHVPIISASARGEGDLDPAAWIANSPRSDYYRAMSLATAAGVPMSLNWNAAAVAILKKAIQAAHEFHEAWYYLGTCEGNIGQSLRRAGQYAEAAKHFEQSIKCFDETLRLKPDHAAAKAFRQDSVQNHRAASQRASPPAP